MTRHARRGTQVAAGGRAVLSRGGHRPGTPPDCSKQTKGPIRLQFQTLFFTYNSINYVFSVDGVEVPPARSFSSIRAIVSGERVLRATMV